jgi:two-component system chemotaxis sensor kinase CheA
MEDFAGLIRDYLDDAGSHLSTFDKALLTLEKDGLRQNVIVDSLGALHTLKGNSGMMGFDSLKGYIHRVEELLKGILDGRLRLDSAMDSLLNSANVIRNTLQEIEKAPSSRPDLTQDTLELIRLIEGGDGKEAREKQHTLSLDSYLGSKTDTIRVDFKRLDNLLNLVGELVIFKTRLNQIEERIKGTINNKPLIRELDEGLQFIGKTVSELQEGIMKARMLPVRHVFHRFPRMVRDLAKSQGKEIQLTFEGEDTELDKTIIDELGEPMLHIIRNAIDHGIEKPDERIKKGKHPAGRITLSATQESNYVIISVSDDGRGIDPERIRKKAIEKEFIRSEDSLNREDVLALIFSPNFSTKEEATDVSGRGIGLDVVSKNISRLNGQVLVDSTPEMGTTFTVKLPLSLAIIPALMAEVSEEVYAIPMNSVEESVKVKEEEIHIVNNREVIRLRERVLPVIRLNQFFGLNGKKQKRFYLIVLGRAEKKIAIAVDRLRGQQDIVIKPLDDTFGKSHGIAGASILGDGRIVLIIDVTAFWAKKEALQDV